MDKKISDRTLQNIAGGRPRGVLDEQKLRDMAKELLELRTLVENLEDENLELKGMLKDAERRVCDFAGVTYHE